MMKILALLFVFVGISPSALAQSGPKIISSDDVGRYLGQTIIVKGVVSADVTSRNNNRFLNMGGVYPNQAFTGYIPSKSASLFSGVPSLTGKTICISGLLKPYRGKPEIIMETSSQLNVECRQ